MQGLEKYTQQMSVVREAIQKSETARKLTEATTAQIGRASCRERE